MLALFNLVYSRYVQLLMVAWNSGNCSLIHLVDNDWKYSSVPNKYIYYIQGTFLQFYSPSGFTALLRKQVEIMLEGPLSTFSWCNQCSHLVQEDPTTATHTLMLLQCILYKASFKKHSETAVGPECRGLCFDLYPMLRTHNSNTVSSCTSCWLVSKYTLKVLVLTRN